MWNAIFRKSEENNMSIKQTAGRNQLGEFAPDFAHFNDDVLFGENWNNKDIDMKTRNCRDYYAHRFLCRLAKGLDGIQSGEGSLEREYACRRRKSQTRR